MFYLDDWKPAKAKQEVKETVLSFEENLANFKALCKRAESYINTDIEKDTYNMTKNSQIQKDAILGVQEAVDRYKDRIEEYLRREKQALHWYPSWYADLPDAIFHEVWGLAGIAEFFTQKYADCSSAKVVGQNIYFLINGKQRLMPQKIDAERRAQLVRALCADDKGIRFDADSHEVYMQDGSRVKIYNESLTMRGQDSIVIRRYILPEYTFEVQKQKETISEDMIPLFMEMINLGYNILFTGAVRTAKTSMLQTFLSYEDPSLEGMLIQTDPEIDINNILPGAPVISLIADSEMKMQNIVKEIVRSDMDWLAYAEARDGASLLTAVRAASKGTRRLKLTFHTRKPQYVCRDIAAEIISYAPAMNARHAEMMVAENFDYIFYFIQCKDKSKKKLKSISELRYDEKLGTPVITTLCEYNDFTNAWEWKYQISPDKERAGREEDNESFERFKAILGDLARKHGSGAAMQSVQSV